MSERVLKGGTFVGITTRASSLLLTTLLSFTFASESVAQRGGGDHERHSNRGDRTAEPGNSGTDVERFSEASERRGTPAEQDQRQAERTIGRDDGAVDGVRRPSAAGPERRASRGCDIHGRRGVNASCAYYYDEDGEYYDSEGTPMPGWSPGEPVPAQAGPAPAAKIASPPQASEDTVSYTPQGSRALKEKLIAGRQNWLAKKRQWEDASTALAQAEYQQEQTGKPVPPGLAAQRKTAGEEAEAAHAALEPLVEQARKAGMSPQLLKLYDQANEF
jgi:hypothetical protein